MLVHLPILLAFLLYLASAVRGVRAVVRSSSQTFLRVPRLYGAALLLHGMAVLLAFWQEGEFSLAQRADYALILSLLAALVAGYFSRLLRSPSMIVLGSCTALMLLSGSSIAAHSRSELALPAGNIIVLSFVHIIPALLAELCLLLAFSVALLLLREHTKIKAGKIDPAEPSVAKLFRLLQRIIFAAFLAIGASVMSGAVWATVFGLRTGTDVMKWISLFILLVVAFLVQGISRGSWSPVRAARLTIAYTIIALLPLLWSTFFAGSAFHAF